MGWKKWAARIAVIAVLFLSAGLLYRTLSGYDPHEILAAIRAIPLSSLFVAILFAAASYLCLATNDWLALRYVAHPLPFRKALLASFVAVSLGHNIGFAALSSGAIRYRFYARHGLGAEDVAKVIVFCGTTIFLGMFVLSDIALFARPDLAERLIGLSAPAMQVLALALASLPLAYLMLSAWQRPLRLFRWTLEFPGLRLALAQIVVGTVNFAFVSACLDAVVSAISDVGYFDVLTSFVLANAATILSHAPGGLGVIETVVLLLLRDPDLIGALLTFRFTYYLLPLAFGGTIFMIVEAYQRIPVSARPGRP